MTSLEKAINLGYLFLTYKPGEKKNHQYMQKKEVHVLMGFPPRFIGKKKVPKINGLFQRGHILEPN